MPTVPNQSARIFLTCLCLLMGLADNSLAAQDAMTQDAPVEGTKAPEAPVPKAPAPKVSFGEMYASVDKAEPIRRAGLRSSLLSQTMRVVPMVIIVEHPSSFLDAIAMWEGPVKFPILYDDGTDLAREHIARFVRAFDPKEVVRVSKPGESVWGKTDDQKQKAISRSLGAAINQAEQDWTKTLGELKKTGVVSPGVVVIDASDKHWAGGLALAAGRFQPVIFIDGPKSKYKELTPTQAEAINNSIEKGLRDLDLSFGSIGDNIDTITLAFEAGIKIKIGPGDRDRVATTDRIGRTSASLGGMRWAWAGQLFGSTASGVYQAMSSLFLPIDSAFIWDGYPSDGQWAQYDGTKAGDLLTKAGMPVVVFDEPRNSLANFKANSSSGPVDASLILMNTKGAQNYFDLPMAPDGQGKPGDLPMLHKPAAIHIVHSFSLSSPFSSRTVGGRWLDRGVYLYAGSVDEPYLTGFVPTPTVAARLLGQLHFGAAVHYDDGQAWKVAVIGDPLKTFSPIGPRLDDIPAGYMKYFDMVQGEFLGDRAKQWLKAGQFTNAMEDFVLTDRDEAVVRLTKAIMKEKPEELDDLGIQISMLAAMREREHKLVLDCFERLSVEARKGMVVRDALWFAGRYLILRNDDPRAMALLRTHLRDGQEIEDAEELAKILRRDSMSDALGLLESLRPTLKGGQITKLDRAINRVRR